MLTVVESRIARQLIDVDVLGIGRVRRRVITDVVSVRNVRARRRVLLRLRREEPACAARVMHRRQRVLRLRALLLLLLLHAHRPAVVLLLLLLVVLRLLDLLILVLHILLWLRVTRRDSLSLLRRRWVARRRERVDSRLHRGTGAVLLVMRLLLRALSVRANTARGELTVAQTREETH